MTAKTYDIIGLGSAIVDVLSFCEEETLNALGLTKGSMALIDEAQAEALYAKMPAATECSGGSAANTLAGIASLEGRAAFVGKVKNDQLGAIFTHDLRACGVHFATAPLDIGPATARCLIFITPDAQRTMNTYLGACTQLAMADVDAAPIARANILYIEGYLWDTPSMQAAAKHAMAVAKAANTRVALTLPDSFCVERHRDAFLACLRDVDILFANEAEIMSLMKAADFSEAVKRVRGACPVVVITRAEKGAVVLSGGDTETVLPEYVAQIKDTTGAGDLFASGFLFGQSRSWDTRAAARLGNACAGRIIQQIGARSLEPLARLVA